MCKAIFERMIFGFGCRLGSVAIGCAVGLGSLDAVPAQTVREGQSVPVAGTESMDSFYTFPGRPIVTVSSHGNIVRFQSGPGVGGAGHFYGEGYVLCHSGVMAFDGGRRETGFGPMLSASCSGDTCTFVRNTSDDAVQLRQTITHLPNEARGVEVTMTLRNLVNYPITKLTLRRFAHVDVDGYGAGTGHASNWWAASQADAVWAWNAPNDHPGPDSMILMRHLARTPGTFFYVPKVINNFSDDSCSPYSIAVGGPVYGDYVGTLEYDINTIDAFSSVAVKLQYQRN